MTIDSPQFWISLVRLKRSGEGQRTALVATDAYSNTGFIDEKPNNNQWLMRIDADKNAHFAGEVRAPQGVVGNADSATRLNTARTLKIGNTGKTFDGTGTPADLGYASGGVTNGWMKRPDGMIEQWGLYLQATTAEVTRTVIFPITFPTACLNVTVTDINPAAVQKIHHDMFSQVYQGSLSKTGFSVFIQGLSGSSWLWADMYWRAIGH